MAIRVLFALTVLCSLAEAMNPAWAFPIDVTFRALQSSDTSGTFIPVKKGKGHGDREDRLERHYRHDAGRHRRHSHGMRGYQGFNFGGGNQNQPNGQN
jgi:hypothetical protein